jgi:hypothetical protein
VIRTDRFLISKRLYAVDLSTLRGKQHERDGRISFHGAVNALWFGRQNGTTRACLGTLGLFSYNLPEPVDLDEPHTVLSANLDGRYGGDCHARWDGESYWGTGTLADQEQHLAILRPMLANFPAIPPGHDGWWRF